MKIITLDKKYKTRDGKRVELHAITEYNSCGAKVTYPVKGTIILREKPIKIRYMIWSINGVTDVVWNKFSNLDLIEQK